MSNFRLPGHKRRAARAEAGWHAARDRITETNEARRDERERCARLVEDMGGISLAGLIREGASCG